MKKFLTTTFLLFIFLISVNLQAQTSNLSIQGVLRSAEGAAVENGDYDITFKLYTQENSGDIIWQEDMENVKVKGGIYSVVLGAGSTPLDVPFNEPYYLGVTVEGGIELTPRAKLTSSPYALSLIGNDNVFPNSGNVGVGSSNPQHKLTVQRGDGILGLEAIEDANNTSTISTTATGMQFDAGGTDKVYAFTNGRVQATADEQFIIEGTNDANIEFSKSSGIAKLGYYGANGNTFIVKNPIGLTHIEGTDITLNPTSGDASIDGNLEVIGQTRIKENGQSLKVIGTTHSYIGFFPQNENQRKGFIGFSDPNSNDLLLKNEAANKDIILATSGTGAVKIPSMVYLQGEKELTDNYFSFLSEPPAGTAGPVVGYREGGNLTRDLSLEATKHIRAKGFQTFSDARIKKDLSISNTSSDLQALNQLEVTDYKHVDEVAHGRNITKGFIAQQVREIFPEATTTSNRFIPNILSLPTKTLSQGDNAEFTLNKKHDLKAGDKIKLMTTAGEVIKEVTNVQDDFSFSVNTTELEELEEIVIYGKEVNDFHTVDYNQIFTLSVSAVQELSRKVDALEKENSRLKMKSTKATQANATLSKELQGMNKRLETIEMIMNGTGNK